MKASPLSELGRRTQDPPISWLMKMTLDRPRLVSLAAGFTDPNTLPVAETRELLRQLLRSPAKGRASLQYGSTHGDRELRRLTALHLQALDEGKTPRSPGEACDPERLLITNGAQQLLYLLTEALCEPGDIVLVEDPTYFVYLGILQSHGLRSRGIRLTDDGLDLAELERILASLKRRGELGRVKMLYTVSYYQNPTGITTRFEKKVGALRLLRNYERAAGHPIYLVEDAAYRELGFRGLGGASRSALAARDFTSRVIYAGTYSKPFATGARVGFGVLPRELFPVVLRLKGNHDFGTSNLLQQLLVGALDSGLYEQHLSVLRARYALKADIMVRAMRRHFPRNVHWTDPHGGLYVWAKLTPPTPCGVKSAPFKAALASDVLYVPGELCYAEDPNRRKPSHEMRLSYGGASVADIREGIARLGQVLTQRR